MRAGEPIVTGAQSFNMAIPNTEEDDMGKYLMAGLVVLLALSVAVPPAWARDGIRTHTGGKGAISNAKPQVSGAPRKMRANRGLRSRYYNRGHLGYGGDLNDCATGMHLHYNGLRGPC
jgi:hypothetical protein